jgi:hypothetical protein
MAYHHITVDGYRQHGGQGHGQQAVAQQRKQAAKQFTVSPSAIPKGAGGQWQVEAAEQ